MSSVFYIHWNREECVEHVRELREAGLSVESHWSTQTHARIDPLPGALVISLERLPSHGRAVAEWFWEAQKRRHIPIVFVGGQADKVAAMRSVFPRARFCSRDDLPRLLKTALRSDGGAAVEAGKPSAGEAAGGAAAPSPGEAGQRSARSARRRGNGRRSAPR